MNASRPKPAVHDDAPGPLVRIGLALAGWSERWFPDPLVFALAGVVVVFLAGTATGESPSALAVLAGKSFWTLAPFTIQMVMVIVGGYVVASTPLVRAAIRKIAGLPPTPRGALMIVVLIAVSTLVAYLSAPPAEKAKTAEDFGIRFDPPAPVQESSLRDGRKPGEWLEQKPLLTVLAVLILGWYLVDAFRTAP